MLNQSLVTCVVGESGGVRTVDGLSDSAASDLSSYTLQKPCRRRITMILL